MYRTNHCHFPTPIQRKLAPALDRLEQVETPDHVDEAKHQLGSTGIETEKKGIIHDGLGREESSIGSNRFGEDTLGIWTQR